MESRKNRFFAPVHELSDDLVRRMTAVDGWNHVALALVESASDAPERIVAVARFVRSEENPSEAEIAVTVLDEFQGRGLGPALVRELAGAAMRRQVETFTTNVLVDNSRAHGMLRGLHAEWTGRDGDVATYRIAVAALARVFALQRTGGRPGITAYAACLGDDGASRRASSASIT
jgi:ribosomal protein S18 acetylase RimI-like enzyme